MLARRTAPSPRGCARRGGCRRACAASGAAPPASTPSSRRDAGLASYASLKAELFRTSATVGALLSAYLLLADASGPNSAASAALGSAAGLAYLRLLCDDVDNVETRRPRRLPPSPPPGDALGALHPLRRAASVYAHALARPQLAVPVALAVACCSWNAAHEGDAQTQLRLIYVLLGFLCYKAAVIDQGVKALKAVTVYAPPASERPTLAPLPEIDPEDDPLVSRRPRSAATSVPSAAEGASPVGRRVAAAALVAAGFAGVSGARRADARVNASCLSDCRKECDALAPGSPEYCAESCAGACDADAVAAAKAAGDAEADDGSR